MENIKLSSSRAMEKICVGGGNLLNKNQMILEACTATRPPTFGMMIFLLLLLPPLLSKCCCRNSGKQNWIIRECLIRLNYSFTELLLLRSKNKWNINDNKSSVGKCILNFDRIKWPHKYRLSYKWIAVRSCTVSYH